MIWPEAVAPEVIHLLHQTGRAGSSLHQAPFDFKPADPIRDPAVNADVDRLTFTWTASANGDGDLTGYRVFRDDQAPVDLPASATSFQVDTTPLTRHRLRVASLDSGGNQGPPVLIEGVTLPASPADIPRPLAYWTMDSADRLGSLPADVAAGHHVYAAAGGSSVVQGLAGQALNLYNNQLDVDGFDALDGTVPALSLWIKTVTFIQDGGLIHHGNDQTAAFDLFTTTDGATGHGFRAGDTLLRTPYQVDKYNQVRGALATNVWHHLALTPDGDDLVLYLDGQEVDRQPLPTVVSLADAILSLGNNRAGGNIHGRAYLDEVLLWDQPLDAATVALLHQLGAAGSPLDQAPVDFRAAAEATNLTVQAGSDQLLLNWAASADEDGDLDAYLVQVDDAAPIEVSGDQLSLTLTDLTPATVVDLRLATRDTHGNISAGLRTAAGTLPADGIITQPTSYWSMDSTATAGSTVQDVVGLNHATTAAAYFNQVGRVEKAIRFNTSSHHVEIPNDPSLDASDGLTLSLWFNATAIIDNGALLVHGTAAEEAYGLTLQQADGQYPVFRFGAPAAPVRIGAVPRSRSGAVLGTLATNTWHHLAARFDAGLVTLWLDGNRIVSEQTGVAELPLVTDAVLTLGRYLPGAGERFVGYLDEVAYWSQSLDEAEILETYQRGVRGLGLVTPTSKQDPERVRPSYEDQGRLVLIDEDREQPEVEEQDRRPQPPALQDLGRARGPAELVVPIAPHVPDDEDRHRHVGKDDPEEELDRPHRPPPGGPQGEVARTGSCMTSGGAKGSSPTVSPGGPSRASRRSSASSSSSSGGSSRQRAPIRPAQGLSARSSDRRMSSMTGRKLASSSPPPPGSSAANSSTTGRWSGSSGPCSSSPAASRVRMMFAQRATTWCHQNAAVSATAATLR